MSVAAADRPLIPISTMGYAGQGAVTFGLTSAVTTGVVAGIAGAVAGGVAGGAPGAAAGFVGVGLLGAVAGAVSGAAGGAMTGGILAATKPRQGDDLQKKAAVTAGVIGAVSGAVMTKGSLPVKLFGAAVSGGVNYVVGNWMGARLEERIAK